MAAAALLGAGPVGAAPAAAAPWSVEAAHPADEPSAPAPGRRVVGAVAGTTFVRLAGGDVERVEARTRSGEVIGTWTLVGATEATGGERVVATVDDRGDAAVYTLTHSSGSVVLQGSVVLGLPAAPPGTYVASVRGGVVHLDGTAAGSADPVE